MTPLHHAATNGHYKVCKILLLRDTSLAADEDATSQTSLHLAAAAGHHLIVKLLLDKGAAINVTDERHLTPLGMAAQAGHFKCVNILLENDALVTSRDKFGNTPLLLASASGHCHIVTRLFEENAFISDQNKRGLTCLDLAAMSGRLDLVRTILKHPAWKLVLDCHVNKTQAGSNTRDAGMTPLKRLVVHLPEGAALVLSKCIVTNDLRPDHVRYEARFDFRYLEEPPEVRASRPACRSALWHMTHHKRSSCLLHPLVDRLLRLKWTRFGSKFYMANLFFYLLFTMFVSAWTIENRVVDSPVFKDLSQLSRVGAIYIQMFTAANVLMELFQLWQLGLSYFNWRNFLDWGVYVTALLMVALPVSVTRSGVESRKEAWNQSFYCAAIAVFLAWMNLLVYVRRFGALGIYVLMMTDTLHTVFKVLSVFSIFIIAFALSFFVLLQDQVPFNTPARSLVKTLVMMTGEYEFDTIFLGGSNCTETTVGSGDCLRFASMAYTLMVVFVIGMNIILMNLLIGLAVGDIEKVADHAALERQVIKVRVCGCTKRKGWKW